jgi:TRAP-type C4-dicarboxylate transport system permease large subunit
VVLSLTEEPSLLLLMVNVLLLLLGCFMEPLPIMVIVVPNMLPLAQALGIDLTHFGVIVTLNLMIGLITPPVRLMMFAVMDITKIPLDRFSREIWPFPSGADPGSDAGDLRAGHRAGVAGDDLWRMIRCRPESSAGPVSS